MKALLAALVVSSIALLSGAVSTALAAPANDNFANAQGVGPTLPVSAPGSTVGATVEAEEGPPADGHTVWFNWTAPANIPVRVETCDYDVVSGPGNAGLFIYTGASIPTLVGVASSFSGCKASFPAVEGTTYRIKFDSYFGGEGNFTLTMFQETPPANDDFADAQAIGPGLPISLTGSNQHSTVEAAEPHHGNGDESSFPPSDSVWYRWEAATTGEVRVRACAADFGPRLGVYTGTAVGSLTRVTPSEPIITFPFCSVRFEAEAGITYRIGVGGGGSEEEGNFRLDLHPFSRPANDDFADAQPIGPALPIAVAGSNIDAGAEQGEPDHTPYEEGGAYTSVWYAWTSTAAGRVRISTCGAQFSSLLAVYTGSAVDELQKVATGEGGCGLAGGHQLDLAASAGSRYLIAVAGTYVDREGPFTLRIHDPLAASAQPVLPLPIAEGKSRFSLKRALRKCRKIKRQKPRRRCIRRARKKAQRLSA